MRPSRAALLAAAAVYLAQLAPFAIGPLTECGHCVRQFLKLYAVLPGVVPALLLRLEGGAFVAVAALGTLVVFATLAALLCVLPRAGRWPALAVAALATGAWAVAFSHALRA